MMCNATVNYIIVSGTGLSPGRYQAINWTNDDMLSIVTPGQTLEMSIKIENISAERMHLKMSSAKSRPLC